ncbi:DUF4347 domain-containing protein [endosymbiont of unidentified scaly snail isolate Monju]|uniref:DUF4347 domain-containing protein n=1 Tax=endosymbiont of unidentified scaly snail isolate Monju TaxID=1248727 RepID=UPI000389238B|nr:DUF4347 domain-containing protein [endosymbiont of unidentified scaly snail isolate Monju]BAN68243.1 hypothetical protein EBS_0260 [endosymbiont of unidentified scaly snail isolate Monju]
MFEALEGTHLIIVDPSVSGAEALVAQLEARLRQGPAGEPAAAAPAPSPVASVTPEAETSPQGPVPAAPDETPPRAPEPSLVLPGGEDGAGQAPRVEVVWLDAERNGVEQVSEILSRHQDLASVHLLSHGAAGLVRLGNSQLDRERLQREQARIARWGAALRPGGDLLLYGCDVAEGQSGVAFVDSLFRLAGVDVAASTDATGDVARGGDWDLEYATGRIEAQTGSLSYAGLLGGIAGNVLYVDGRAEGNFQTSRTLDPVRSLDLSTHTGDLEFRFQKGGWLSVAGNGITLKMQLAANAGIKAGTGNNTVLFSKGASFTGALDLQGSQSARLGFSSNLDNPDGLLVRGETRPVRIDPVGTDRGHFRVRAGSNDFEILNLYTAQSLVGGRGADTLVGADRAQYRDVLLGGRGSDRLYGQAGDDTLKGGAGADEVHGGAGVDQLFGGGGDDVLFGDAGNDALDGGTGKDHLLGGDGVDTLQGGGGADVLQGGAGNDTLIGGAGDDSYAFLDGWGTDTLIESSGNGRDALDFSAVSGDISVQLSATLSVDSSLTTLSGSLATGTDVGLNGAPAAMAFDDTDFADRLVAAVDFAMAVGELEDTTPDTVQRVHLDAMDLTPVETVGTPEVTPVNASPVEVGYAAGRLALAMRDGSARLTVDSYLDTRPPQTGMIVVLAGVGPVGSALDFDLRIGSARDAVRVQLAAQSGVSKTTWLANIEQTIVNALNGTPQAQPPAVTKVIDVKYLNGRLAFGHVEGRALTLWSGPNLSQQTSGGLVFLDQPLPADGAATVPLTFKLRIGGTLGEQVTVTVPSQTFTGSDGERRAAWTRVIADEINRALAGVVPNASDTAVVDTIDQAAEDAWLAALQAAVDATFGADRVDVGYADGHVTFTSLTGEDIAVWDDPATAPTTTLVSHTNASRLAGVQAVEHLKLGRGDNTIKVDQAFVDQYAVDGLFNKTLSIENPLAPNAIPEMVLDLSGVTRGMHVTVESGEGLGNRVTVAFTDSSGTLGNLLAKKLVVTNVGRIIGGAGNDLFTIEDDAVVHGGIDGGAGSNTLEYRWQAGEAISLMAHSLKGLPAGFEGFANLKGGERGDLLDGNAADNRLDGSGGDDQLVGWAGNDELVGNAGNDVMRGGEGSDRLRGGSGQDYLEGGAGDDVIEGGRNDDILVGGSGNDTLSGGWGRDTYRFEDGWGHDVIKGEKLGSRTDIVDLSAVTDDLSYSLAAGKIELGTGTFTRDTGSLPTGNFTRATGTFSGNNTLLVEKVNFLARGYKVRTIETGSGNQRFYFGNDWKRLDIDTSAMNANSTLLLDFSAATVPLRFDFREDGSLVVSKISGLDAIGDSVPGLSPTSITIDQVDANTTIVTGRSENVYRVYQGTSFQGTLELTGGLQYRQIPLTENAVLAGLYVQHTLDLSRYGVLTGSTQLSLAPPLTWPDTATNTQKAYDVLASGFTPGSVDIPGIANLVKGERPTDTNGIITDVKYGAGANFLLGDVMPNTFSSSLGRVSASVMSGLVGPDTYKFSNLWGLAVIPEMPDVQVTVNGQAYTAPESLDTLDFSSMVGDIEVDIYQYSAAEAFALITDAIGGTDLAGSLSSYSGPDIVSNYVVVRDTTLANAATSLGISLPGGFTTSVVLAMDIESIIGPSAGTMKVNFHGDASLKGTLEAGSFGDIVLDYSDYGKNPDGTPITAGQGGVTVNLDTGLDLPGPADLLGLSLPVPPGDSPAFGVPGLGSLSEAWNEFMLDRHTNRGQATGVEGNRLGGLTTLMDLAGPHDPSNAFLAKFGVKGVSKIIGSAFDDQITADDTRVVLVASDGTDSYTGIKREGRPGSDDALDLSALQKDGLRFQANEIQEVRADLGNWHGVTIDVTGTLSKLRLSGTSGVAPSAITITRAANSTSIAYGGKTLLLDGAPAVEIVTDGAVLDAGAFSPDALVSTSALPAGLALSAVSTGDIEAAFAAFDGVSLDGQTLAWDAVDRVLKDGSGTVLLRADAIRVDLPDLALAMQLPDGTIRIDSTAAGHGWGAGTMDLASVLRQQIGLKLSVDISGSATLAAGASLSPAATLTTSDIDPTAPLMAGGWPAGALTDVAQVPQALIDAARQAWVGTWVDVVGNTRAGGKLQLADIPVPSLRLVDLPEGELARTLADGTVLLDPTAADHGWFVDSTPATANDLAAGRIDLYSVLVHEIGHALGLGHDTGSGNAMDVVLSTAARPAVPGSSQQQPVQVVNLDSSDQSRLREGFQQFRTWIDGVAQRVDGFLASDIPFTNLRLADFLPASAADLNTRVQSLITDIENLFANGNNVDSQAIAGIGGVSIAPGSNGKAFTVSLPVSTATQTLGIDLSSLSLDFNAVPGLENLHFGVNGNASVDLAAALRLDFGFGLDENSGEFYVDAPAVILDLSLANPDVNLGVSLGPVGLAIQNGVIDIGTEMRFGTDSRLDMAALQSGVLPPSALLPELGGNTWFNVDLPLVLDTGLDGLQANAAAIRASLPENNGLSRIGSIADLFSNVQLSAQGLEGLFDLKGLSVQDVVNGLIQVLDGLIDPSSAVYTTLPGIDRSLMDLLGDGTSDFLTAIRDRLVAVRDGAGTTLVSLENELNRVFNDFLGAGSDPFSLTYQDSSLALDFSFEKVLADSQYAFALDLNDYASQIPLPPGVGLNVSLGDANGNIGLGLLATAAMDIGLSWDLGDLAAAPVPEIAGDSGVRFDLEAGFQNPVDFQVGLDLGSFGSVDFLIANASADIDMAASFGLDGLASRYALGDMSAHLDGSLGGMATLDLPMFFPDPGTPLGSQEDQNGDGIPDNVLHFDAGFDLGTGIDWQVVAPDIGDLFSLSALLNDPARVLSGLEAMFDTLENGMLGRFASLDLPVVGDAIQDAGNFVSTLRQSLLGDKTGGSYRNGLGLDLQRLVVDADGRPQRDANGDLVYAAVTGPQDIDLMVSPEAIGFNLQIGGQVFSPRVVPFTFGGGLPGLNLSADGGLQVSMDYVFGLGFGLSATDGVYLDTSGATASGAEFALNLAAELLPGTTLEANLAFLRAQLTDVADADGGSGLFGEFEVDLTDGDGNGRFGRGDTLGLEARIAAYANADIQATLDMPVSGGLSFPSIETTIHYDQQFVEATFGPGVTSIDLGGSPQLVFEDVTLDAGGFITGFMGPIVDKVAEILGPVRPVIEMLTREIGFLKQLGSPATSLLDLARLVLGNSRYGAAVKFIDAVVKLDAFAQAIQDLPPDGLFINFGTFDIDTGNPAAPAAPPTARPGTEGSLDTASSTPGGTSTNSAAKSKARSLRDNFLVGDGGFSFPLLTNPGDVVGLLLGKDVDLFIYDMPKLVLSFDYRRSFPIFPGLNARIGGGVSATADFGFDTSGLRAFFDSGFTRPDLIFTGFFVDDQVVDAAGNRVASYSQGQLDSGQVTDLPEVTMTAGIVAGASVGISGLVEAGVDGGIKARVDFDLNDLANPGTGRGTLVEAQYDNKLRVDEILTRLDQDPLCLFEMHGAVRAFLEAFFWVGLDLGFFGEVTLFEARKRFVDEVLADFDHDCPDPAADIAQLDANGTLTLEYRPDTSVTGERIGERPVRYMVDVAHVDNPASGPPRDVLRVTSRGVSEDFELGQVKRIVTGGTAHDDEFVIGKDVTADLDLSTGDGDDIVRVLAATAGQRRIVRGGAGNDTIETADGADSVYGGAGDDILMTGGGDDSIWGDAGLDQIEAGAGNDVVHGGDGRDFILAGEGGDLVWGDAGKDRLEGGVGNDELHGGAAADVLLGQDGDDRLFGDADSDTLTGGAGRDRVDGGLDSDTIHWYVGDGSDLAVAGGTGTQNGNTEEQDTFKAHARVAREADDVRLSAVGADVKVDFNRASFVLQGVEHLSFDLGEGADRMSSGDLSATTVTRADVDFGTGEILDTVAIVEDGVYEDWSQRDANGLPTAIAVSTPRVFRVTDPYDAASNQQPDIRFYRQVAADGSDGPDVAYDILADGSLDLVTVTHPILGQVLVQRRDGVAPTDFTAYNLEAFETRTEQRSHRSRAQAHDATGNPLIDAQGNPVYDEFITPVYGLDSQQDLLQLFGGAGADDFRVSTGNGVVIVSQAGGVSWAVSNSNVLHDELEIDGQGGDDRLDASLMAEHLLTRTVLRGGDGADRLIGSDYLDHLDGGAGDDRVTGGKGVDTFANTGGGYDTLVETRDADFELSDTRFVVHELAAGVNVGTATDPRIQRTRLLTESEDVTGVFSQFILSAVDTVGQNGLAAGTASVNQFYVHDFTSDSAILDGGDAGDVYDIQLSSTASGEFSSLVDIRDRGTNGLDGLLVRGSNENDVFHFDKDIVERITPRPGDQGANSIFAPVADYSTEIIVRDTSLGNVSRQTVNYLTTELFTTHGRGGDDLFLVDDSSTELQVYGDAGDDRFFIGNVLETQQINDPRYGLVTAVKRITNGVSFPSRFYGGTGDDYFEVNHNIAEIFLYGQEDDELFYIKALLTTPALNPDGLSPDDDINVANDGEGADTLVYVKNAPINIFGGSGFDTLVVVGTEIDDTFYVFTEMVNGREVQRVYGAGLNIPTIEGIERLRLITGGGDDTVYFYGSLEGQEIIVDTGAGNDTIHVGGPARDFEVEIPASQRTQIKRVPQPPIVTYQNILVRPAYTWWEVRYAWYGTGLFGAYLFPYWVRHDEPPIYLNVPVVTPQPDLEVPVVITQPASVVPIHMPASRDLSGIKGSVIFTDGNSEDGQDRLIVDNSDGAPAADEGLYRQEVRTLKVSTDTAVLAGILPAWMGVADVDKALKGLIRQRSAIIEPDLADALAAGQVRTVVIPKGYRLGTRAPGADTSDVDLSQAEVKVDPDTGDVLIYATRDIALGLPAGYVTSVKIKQSRIYDAIGKLGSAHGLLYAGFSDIEVQLAQRGGNDFTVRQTANKAVTHVYGNGGGDRFTVKATTGPLHLHGDTSTDYYETLAGLLPQVGRLLNLVDTNGNPVDFDPSDPVHVTALLQRLETEQGLGLDVASLRQEPTLDAEVFNEHIMAQVRFLRNRLGDAGAWISELTLVGDWLGLGRDFDTQSVSDRHALIDRFNQRVADPAERIPVYPPDDQLDTWLTGKNDLIWEMLKADYNPLQGNEHYRDWAADVRIVLGLNHDFDPTSTPDLLALIAMLNDKYVLGINPDQAQQRLFFGRTGTQYAGQRFTIEDVQPEIWRLLVANGLASAPAGDDTFVIANDLQQVDEVAGPLFLYGQAGNDTALVDDRGNAVESEAILRQSQLTGLGMLNGITFSGLVGMEIHTGSARDQFNVQGVLPDTRLYLHGGDDRVYVSSQAAQGIGVDTDFLRGDLDAVAGNLDIDFGAGRHKLMVSDEATTVSDTGAVIASDRITGLSQGEIRYIGAGNLADGVWIWTSQGADRVEVRSTRRDAGVNTLTSVNTGGGDDQVVTALQAGGDGALAVHLGAGNGRFDGQGATRDLWVFGSLGDDELLGGSGDDALFGDDGRILFGGPVTATLGNGGPGDFTDGILGLPRQYLGITTVAGGTDTVLGGEGNDVLFGGAGADVLRGAQGDDRLFGDFGERSLDATGGEQNRNLAGQGAGDDLLFGDAGNDVLFGGAGGDHLSSGEGDDRLFGDFGRWSLDATGGEQARNLTGQGAGDDQLSGDAGNDVLFGGAGGDRLSGGDDDDRLFGDFGQWSLQGGVETAGTVMGTGGAADVLSGNAGNDVLFGGAGGDRLDGGAGSDSLVGDYGLWQRRGAWSQVQADPVFSGGNDTLTGGAGNDFLLGGHGSDIFVGSLREDVMLGEFGRLTLQGGDVRTVISLAGDQRDVAGLTQDQLYTWLPPLSLLAPVSSVAASRFDADTAPRAGEQARNETLHAVPAPPAGQVVEHGLDALEPTDLGRDPAACGMGGPGPGRGRVSPERGAARCLAARRGGPAVL